MILTPAYGRDYKSARDVKSDYYSGKDFIFNKIYHRNDGMYCSCRDFKDEVVTIRYHKQQRVTTAKFTTQDDTNRYTGE